MFFSASFLYAPFSIPIDQTGTRLSGELLSTKCLARDLDICQKDISKERSPFSLYVYLNFILG